MIRINLPSPSDLSAQDFFEQMELTLYHAKKAYEKFLKGIPEKKQEDVSLRFNFPEIENNKTWQRLTSTEEITYEDTQEIELVIDY